MVKYGEAFKGRHTALNTRCSEGKEKSVKGCPWKQRTYKHHENMPI